MRILVLTKRQYTARDLLDDRYGRLYELPAELAARGHEVSCLAWSYQRRGGLYVENRGVRWWSEDLLAGPGRYWKRLRAIVRDTRPQAIWACSDAVHIVLGAFASRKLRLPLVADLYDDFESFRLTSIPLLRNQFRRACEGASALSVVSHVLASTLSSRMKRVPPIKIIGNGVPGAFSLDVTRTEARRHLGLPLDVPLIGTAGALDASRGISDLFEAYSMVRNCRPDALLVLAGPRDHWVANAMKLDGILDLGVLPSSKVPWLYQALNIGVVCNRDTLFGRACYPQKLAEMVASRLPLVAANVGEVADLLRHYPGSLFSPGNPNELADRLCVQLDRPSALPAILSSSWGVLAADLDELLRAAIDSYATEG